MTTLASIAPVSIHSRAGHRETRARSLRPAVRASPRRNKGVVICEAAADKDFACRVASLAAAIAVVAYEPLPAIAAFGQSTIELSNISYTVVECPTGKRSMTQGKPACLLVKADSVNPSKETVYNADVFGRVTDKGGDNALDNDAASDAGRIANIAEVPPGNGTVSFNISVAAQSAELGLNFRGFKARSYPGGAFGGNSPLLGIVEEGCDIYADLECADRYLGK